MRQDIAIPEVKNVFVAAIELTEENGGTNWWIYLINDTQTPLENILIQSRGYSDLESKGGTKTASLRKLIQILPAQSATKIEPLMAEVMGLFNEYWISFFEDGQMKDRKYIFGPHTINAAFNEPLPVIGENGILIK
jgi:hypothetical protein